MKMFTICALAILTGCATSDSLSTISQRDTNVINLTRICPGMNEAEVMMKMHCPVKEETYTVGEDQYDVWFYVTSPTVMNQTRYVHSNLTPLTFKNDILMHVGWDYYKWVRAGAIQKPVVIETPAPTNEDTNLEKVLEGKAPTTAPEDTQLEKALEAPSTVAPAESPKAPNPIEEALQPPPPIEQKKCSNDCPGLLLSKSEHPEPEEDEEEEEQKPKKKKVDMDEEDEGLLHEEQEQDFNFW